MKVGVSLKDYTLQVPKDAIKLMEDRGLEVEYNQTGRWMSDAEFAEFLKDKAAVIGGLENYNSSTLENAKDLKIIARYGVGMDNMDLPYIKKKGIRVSTIVNHEPVAEFVVMQILALLKKLIPYDRNTRAGEWSCYSVRTVSAITLGIIGFGKIGKEVAKRMRPFGCRILVSDPFCDPKTAESFGAELADNEQIFKTADVITLHCPSIPQTYHLINKDTIAMMKDGACLVNASRGAVVDEKALYEALKSGKLAGAAADVFETEPLPKDSPLRELDNLIITPHVAAQTDDQNYNCGMDCAQSIINVLLDGKDPVYTVI